MFRTAAASNHKAGTGGVSELAAPGHGPAFQHPDTFQHAGDVSGNTSIATSAAATGSAAIGLVGAGGDVAHHSTKRGQSKYPFRMNFYITPPTQGFEVTMDEFETWALDRLRVLAEIESCQARGRPFPEMIKQVADMQKKHLNLSSNGTPNVNLFLEREKDHVSHFVLRLAFCRSEELRRRFVKAETTLFKLRFESDDLKEREMFLDTLKLDWKAVSEEEKERLRIQLQAANPRTKRNWQTERFYKVPFVKVLDLVERRRVYMEAGFAYVPSVEQTSLIMAEYTSRLEEQLEMTARHIPRRLDMDEEDRLIPVLEHLSMGLLVGLSSATLNSADLFSGEGGSGKLTWNMVDALIKRHAPMCMRNLQETLNTKHHLKHWGRLQYNLFLKELGLPVEEALVFWRKSFSLITDDKFRKDYQYNVRHGYGLEGARKNYPAYNCAKILTVNQPGPQDTHGCPFRHMSTQNLQTTLWNQYGVPAGDAGEILKAVKDGHYHVGCTRLFEITHRKAERGGIKKGQGIGPHNETVAHPNRYFERSYVLEKEAKERGGAVFDGGEEEEELKRPDDAEMNEESAAQGEEEAAPLPTQSSFGGDVDDMMLDLDQDDILALEAQEAQLVAQKSSAPVSPAADAAFEPKAESEAGRSVDQALPVEATMEDKQPEAATTPRPEHVADAVATEASSEAPATPAAAAEDTTGPADASHSPAPAPAAEPAVAEEATTVTEAAPQEEEL